MARLYGFYDKEKREVIWVPYDKVREAHFKRINNPVAPMVMGDTIEATKHHGDGRVYESRSAFNRATKACGLSDGWSAPDDWNTNGTYVPPNLQEIREDVDQAYDRAVNDLKWGAAELSDSQKEYAKEVNEVLEARLGTSKIET